MTALCGYSRYAYETQLAQGFIPLGDGCRAGVCGRVTRDNEGAGGCRRRLPCVFAWRETIRGASDSGLSVFRWKEDGSAAYCCSARRDAARRRCCATRRKKLAGDGIRVSVCDEREELFPTEDAAQAGIDVMRGVDKATAMQMLLRAMAPQAIFCDEIGDMRDVQALLDAARCGVGLLASAHAGVLTDVLHRPVLRALYEAGAFERYLLLGRHGKLAAAYDAEGKPISGRRESMRNTAVMAMISLSAIGFAVADGEMRRVRWIQAMRRPDLRMNDIIRYERLPLATLLAADRFACDP